MFLTAAAETADTSFSIESIKEIMDAFDPASLLPDLNLVFDKLLLICRIAVLIGPVLMLCFGLAYLFLAPKEANYLFGYRCFFGMGSQYAWRYTQRIAGIVFSGLGLILTIVMLVISASLPNMELMAAAWRAVYCLAWEAGLSVLAVLAVNLILTLTFDAKGMPRKYKKQG